VTGKKRNLATELLVLDSRLQCRDEVPNAIINEYREAWRNQVKFPPIQVYQVDDEFLVVDGFCRVMAANSASKSRVPCEVHQGTFSDALRAACGANASHGLRRTIADKKRAATIAIKHFPELSSRDIAEICGVSHAYIQNLRKPDDPEQSEADEVEAGEGQGEDVEAIEAPATSAEKSNVTKIGSDEESDFTSPPGWSCVECGATEQRLSDGGNVCRVCLCPVDEAVEPPQLKNPVNTRVVEPEEVETFPDPEPSKLPKVHQVWGQFIRACEAAKCSHALRSEIETITRKLQGLR